MLRIGFSVFCHSPHGHHSQMFSVALTTAVMRNGRLRKIDSHVTFYRTFLGVTADNVHQRQTHPVILRRPQADVRISLGTMCMDGMYALTF